MPAIFDNTLQRRRFLQLGSLGAVSFFAGRLQAAEDSPPAEKFRVALLSDTHIPGDRINGHLGFVHHTFGEGDGDLLDGDRLFELLKPHPQVKAIFYGHSHHWAHEVRQGLQLVNLRAVSYNFQDQDPVGWVDAGFDKLGVTLTLHAIAGNASGHLKPVRLEWT